MSPNPSIEENKKKRGTASEKQKVPQGGNIGTDV
jgi:hypothetical protein